MSNQLPVPFTPGPWAVESDTDIVSNSGDFVASCHEPGSDVGTAREYANAIRNRHGSKQVSHKTAVLNKAQTDALEVIDNFILYFTSDEAERERMSEVALDYIEQDHVLSAASPTNPLRAREAWLDGGDLNGRIPV